MSGPSTPRQGGRVLPFPAGARAKDPLIERLPGYDPERDDRCLLDWADTLDAAILAACLLERPSAELARREASARRAGRDGDAAFWRDARTALAAITGRDIGSG